MDLYFKYKNSKEEALIKAKSNIEISQESKLNINVVKQKPLSSTESTFLSNVNHNIHKMTFEEKAEYLLSHYSKLHNPAKKAFLSRQHSHKLYYCTSAKKGYNSGWYCDICKKSYGDVYKSLHCKECQWDICDECFALDIEYLE